MFYRKFPDYRQRMAFIALCTKLRMLNPPKWELA
jgi:hypothetical protein